MELKDVNGAVLFHADYRTITKCLKQAVECNVDLTGLDLRDKLIADTDLSELKLNHANLSGTTFRDSFLDNASFKHAIMKGTQFKETTIFESDFSNADLIGAEFRNCRLTRNLLLDCTLEKVDFDSSGVIGCDFAFSLLKNVNFYNCDLKNSSFADCGLVGLNLVDARNIFSFGPTSDGFIVYVINHTNGINIAAGCHWYELYEAKKLYDDDIRNVGDERRFIIRTIEEYCKILGWI